MFDNLRDESNYEDEQAKYQSAAGTSSNAAGDTKPGRVLGMTAPQRFVITFMLMITVCILGAMCLLVTGKIGF